MILMDRKTRRKMAFEAKNYGGISIPHTKLQVHQNGAKFPISKVYIDDEQLDPDMFYTLIIIPEGVRLSQEGTALVLMHFHSMRGPEVFEALPAKQLSDAARETCVDWFDMCKKPGFFTASAGEQFGFNYMFEIPNKAARIGKEIFMLSLLTDGKQSTYVEDLVDSILDEQAKVLKGELEMFFADHPDTKKELTDAEKIDKEKDETRLREKIKDILKKAKSDIDRSLEIQEKMDLLGYQAKKSRGPRFVPEGIDQANIIKAVILSIQDEKSPFPEIVLINEEDGVHTYTKDQIKDIKNRALDPSTLTQISYKSIGLLAGEQDGSTSTDKIKFFGILPYPDIKMNGFTYFFLIPNPSAPGKAIDATITVLVPDSSKSFFYKHVEELRSIVFEHTRKIKKMLSPDEFASAIKGLFKDLDDFID